MSQSERSDQAHRERVERAKRRSAAIRDVDRIFGANLREARKRAGMTQGHMASLLRFGFGGYQTPEWHQTTIAKIETGKRAVKLVEAVALAELLEVPLMELLGEAGDRG